MPHAAGQTIADGGHILIHGRGDGGVRACLHVFSAAAACFGIFCSVAETWIRARMACAVAQCQNILPLSRAFASHTHLQHNLISHWQCSVVFVEM